MLLTFLAKRSTSSPAFGLLGILMTCLLLTAGYVLGIATVLVNRTLLPSHKMGLIGGLLLTALLSVALVRRLMQ